MSAAATRPSSVRERGRGGPAAALPPIVRCAVYTRKSTEEGLNQEFNSLDAQRESALAFIASQKHAGWVCLPEKYDDGGFTGGNIERPALKRLMADIEAGAVDCVVVYKVDRLSRSLLDFSRIMELFERTGVSFVSVTQQFNTTHSMGRLADRLADRMASGEGVQDALLAQPEMLFQTDEIDSLLTSMTVVRDARYESLMSTLLTLYSSSSTMFPLRRRAGDEDRTSKFIESPCLVLFGTAIPSHFYSALSERMLTNGLIGRTLILESGKRGEGQEPRICDPPKRVLAVAKRWADRIRIADTSRRLTTVPSTDQAMTIFADVRRETDARYSEASDQGEATAATIWGRVNEHVRKLALLYAVSVSHRRPCIDGAAAEWARDLVMHLTRRMLHMVSRYSADTPFESLTLRVIRKLEDHGAAGATRSEVLRALKVDADTCQRVTQTLIERGEIVCEERPTGGRSSRVYRLAAKKGERSGKEVGDKSPAGGSE